MKSRFQFFSLLFLLFKFIVGSASAASSVSTEIPLDAPNGFSAVAIGMIGNGKYCVSGSVYDDAAPGESAMVILVDANNHQAVWRTRIPYGRDYVGNRATQCLSDGNAYYVVTQESTNSSEALNQTRVVINKISVKGTLLAQQPVSAGFDEWSYLLDVQPNAISVGGGTSATLNRGGKFSTFIARFDSNLAQKKTIKLDSGAFWIGSNAKLDDRHLLVSGQFFPNTASSSGHEAFAASMIDLGSSKYAWSNYAPPADTRQAISLFAADGVTYTAALTATNLTIAWVDRTGKTVNSFATAKPLCSLEALALDGHVLKAIGSSCERSSSSVIGVVDLTNQTAVVVRQLEGEVSAPQFDGQSWVGIVDVKKHGKVFRRSAQ